LTDRERDRVCTPSAGPHIRPHACTRTYTHAHLHNVSNWGHETHKPQTPRTESRGLAQAARRPLADPSYPAPKRSEPTPEVPPTLSCRRPCSVGGVHTRSSTVRSHGARRGAPSKARSNRQCVAHQHHQQHPFFSPSPLKPVSRLPPLVPAVIFVLMSWAIIKNAVSTNAPDFADVSRK